MTQDKANTEQRKEMILNIVRMSQKALGCIIALIAVGYLGGTIAIIFEPSLADALCKYANVFVPVFMVEITAYGLGSTLENVQKIKTQVDSLNASSTDTTGGNG